MTSTAPPVPSLPRRLLDGLAELLLPARCAACDAATERGEPFCDACTPLLEAVHWPCPRCALPLPPAPEPHSCLGCLQSPPPWTRARAPMAFAGPLASAVRRWKLGGEPALTGPLARLLAPSLARLAEVDALVPVPLHPRRLRQREFNQASLLARTARDLAHSPLPVEELLDRVVDTPPQSRMKAQDRARNVRRAFALAGRSAERVRGRRLVLVDDVVTTGATASACAVTLLRAGAERVDLLALARTLP